MSAAVPTCRSLVFVCGKILFHKLMEKSERLSIKMRGGAGKSLARPGKKRTTVTKLRIYSTCSPRSSIHFLAHCSSFCRPLKNKIQKVVHSTRSLRQQCPPYRTKNGDLSIVFSGRGTGGSRMGPDPENRVGELGHCGRTRPPWWPSCGIFPSKCPSVAPAEMNNTPHW